MSLSAWSDLLDICNDKSIVHIQKRVTMRGVLIKKESAEVLLNRSKHDKDKFVEHLVLQR